MIAKQLVGAELAPITMIVAAAATTVIGRVALKTAALKTETLISPPFVVAAVMSLVATVCWLAALRGAAPLAMLAVIYGMTTMLALMTMDALLFGARIDLRGGLGMLCAIAAIGIVNSR